jgi:hypothetical protein
MAISAAAFVSQLAWLFCFLPCGALFPPTLTQGISDDSQDQVLSAVKKGTIYQPKTSFSDSGTAF